MVLATQAWFDAVNAQGGVLGRLLRAVAFDEAMSSLSVEKRQ